MCVTSRLFFCFFFFYVTDPCRQARQFSPFSLANPTSYPNPFSFLSIKERQTTKSFAKTDGGSCLPFFFFVFPPLLLLFCIFIFLLENCLKAPQKSSSSTHGAVSFSTTTRPPSNDNFDTPLPKKTNGKIKSLTILIDWNSFFFLFSFLF